jgi:DNA-binding CsgD family transcriptional regulator/tetratricopeptide (TPR) repeat protein
MRLLERDDQTRVLDAALERASERRGRVALVHGAAGIGKSSLVRAFAGSAEAARAVVRIGACDDLLTTRAFAPFRDIARGQSRLGRALDSGADAAEVLDAILEDLDDPLHPVVVIIEDLQWADDATLDALVVVARRIERLPALLVATYRDTEIDRRHPLRRVLGALGAAGVEHIALGPLSEAAVAELVGDADRAAEIHRITGGNPFYVLELAAATPGTVPTTVRDAVLTRLLALPRPTQEALEVLAVIPTRAERWLVEAVHPGGGSALDAAERAGLVTGDADTVAFRHEIARRAVESDLPTGTRVARNAAVAAALIARDADATRILHHAVEAGDADAVLRHGPVAAREASRLGSHREALQAYRQVHRFIDRLPADERAGLAVAYAYELQLGNRHGEAAAVAGEAVEELERVGDTESLADALLVLSRAVYWHRGAGDALPHAQRAIALLDVADASPVLAMAYAHMSRLHLLANRNAEAAEWSSRALEVAGRSGHLPAEAGARITHGAATLNLGDDAGLDEVTHGLELARTHGFHESVIRGYFQIGVEHMRRGELDRAETTVHEGRAYAADNQVTYGAFRLDGLLGCLALNRGTVDDAQRILSETLAGEVEPATAGVQPRGWLAQALARLGDPEAATVAAEAWSLASTSDEAPLLGAAAAAVLEAAWLSGTTAGVDEIAAQALVAADATGHPWYAGDLRVGLRRAGLAAPPPADPSVLLDAHAASLRGDHLAAAEAWDAAGYHYEQAVELAHSDDRDGMLDGLRLLDDLGAVGTANRVRATLRARGVTSVPRGPTRGTRRNPAGLTNRQVDVLALLTEGMTNAEIADRLVVSVRTVDHHVSAILDKLDVSTRQEAAALAVELGVTD